MDNDERALRREIQRLSGARMWLLALEDDDGLTVDEQRRLRRIDDALTAAWSRFRALREQPLDKAG